MDDTPRQPPLLLTGELVALGPVERAQAALHARWLNDFGTLRTLGSLPAPRTSEAIDALYQSTIVEQPDTFAILTVYDRETLKPIGYTTLQNINHRTGTAELTLAIGDPAYRGRGYGTETVRLMLGFAFDHLGLHNIMLRYYAFNLAGRRAYEKAGFTAFARIRDGFEMGGRRWDVILMEAVTSSPLRR
jgi:RimJ/RimL family protein N-acetyltransferase